MKDYKRAYPLFSACGLNCGLCSRYHTDGLSKCPGCAGKDFSLRHPPCGVLSFSQKRGFEYCFLCDEFPCKKYDGANLTDSFITHYNQLIDLEKVQNIGIKKYKEELNEKIEILKFLLDNYNDGRRKNFYCLAVNLLKLSDIKNTIKIIDEKISIQNIEHKDKINQIVSLFKDKAKKQNIKLELRKKTN